MAHPRKKRRTQAPNSEAPSQNTKTSTGARIPKSMVVRMGASDVGPSVTQLVHDTRQVMEPHTASRLKERRSNKLRDYTTMAGPLGVSHLMLFSRGKETGNVNLRLAITPRGPTMNFRVEKYSLCKDIAKSQKKPKAGNLGKLEHVSPPLLVMNNFSTSNAAPDSKIPKHLEALLTSTFQSLFPPIAPQTTPLASIKRVLLLNRETVDSEDGVYIVNLRHYSITSRVIHQNLSRGIKRLQRVEKHAMKPKASSARPGDKSAGPTRQKTKGNLPNLGRLDDVADYVLDPASGGYTSASETEIDTDAEVDVLVTSVRKVMNKRDRTRVAASREEAAQVEAENADPDESEDGEAVSKKKGRRPPPVQKRAIKLTEIGPRMRLRLVKVEEGLCEGKILWHEYITKSREEERKQEAVWDQRKKEKEERRRIQKENLAAKKAAKGPSKKGEEEDDDEEEDFDEDMDDDEWDDENGEQMDEDVVSEAE